MAIIVMDDGKEINLDKSWSSTILVEKAHCKKVCFDLTQLKKKEKVYSAYNIPRSENILAFCKDSIPLIPITTGGIIFTDQALYCCPALKLEDGTKCSRFSYLSLDSFIITQEGTKGGVFLHTENRTLCLYAPTLIAQNIAGSEIKKILCKIQRKLFQRDSTAKSKFEALASKLLQNAKTELGIDALSNKVSGILDCLMEFPSHANDAAMLKAEYIFREFNLEKYKAFAASLPFLVSWETKNSINSIPSSFAENYILLLSDVDREFPYDSLSKIYKQINSYENQGETHAIICTYLCIRMVDNSKIESQISNLRRQFGINAAEKLEWFRCVYFYHEMYKVYQAITNDTEYPKNYLRLRDGLGLTPLHYAIILKNEKAIKHLLSQQDWKIASPHGSSATAFQMYEYAVVAAGKQLPNIQDILLKTNKEAIELRAMIRHISNRLKFMNVVHFIQDVNLNAHKRAYANGKARHVTHEDLEVLTSNIDNIKEKIKAAEDDADSLKATLRDCEESLIDVMEYAIDEALSFLEDVRNENIPLANYLYRIFFEPDFFKKVLKAARKNRNLHLYHYEGFYFVAPEFAQIELPYQGQVDSNTGSKESMHTDDKPPYGNSWFSSDAHLNIDVLKSEYRVLAKMYHPDVCKAPNSNELFTSISAEYSSLYRAILAAQTTQ